MVMRRALVESVGDFDVRFGPGAPFLSADDTDMAFRALRAGSAVLQDSQSIVVHWGARGYENGEVRRLLTSYGFATGAMYAKHIRQGDVAAGFLLVDELGTLLTDMLRSLVEHRPLGVRRLASTVAGAFSAFSSSAC
jgi:hypothetical protein